MITITTYIRSGLHSYMPAISTNGHHRPVINAPAFAFAEGRAFDTGAVAFAPCRACLEAAAVQENGTCH